MENHLWLDQATPIDSIMAKIICFEDFEEEARKKLSKQTWGFISSGDHEELTVNDNLQAFNR